jgi:hypothetical protein
MLVRRRERAPASFCGALFVKVPRYKGSSWYAVCAERFIPVEAAYRPFTTCPFRGSRPSALPEKQKWKEVKGVMSGNPIRCNYDGEAGFLVAVRDFIHCADLHLGSPGNGPATPKGVGTNAASDWRNAFENAPSEALSNLVTLAMVRRVVFVPRRRRVRQRGQDPRVAARFSRATAWTRSGGIASIWSRQPRSAFGVGGALTCPSRCTVSARRSRTFPFSGWARRGRIYGFSYPRRDVRATWWRDPALRPEPEIAGEDVFRIGLLHSNVGGGPGA